VGGPIRPFTLIALGITVVFAAALRVLVGGEVFQGIDDADITMVYARNIAAGFGYVYTPGYERVEGSTSLGWTLICAAAYAISSNPPGAVFATNAVLCAASCYGAMHLSRCLGNEESAKLRGAVTLGFLLASPDFFAWNLVTMMDTALWCCAVTGATWTVVFLPWSTGLNCLASAALLVARPEALLLVPLLVLLNFVGLKSRGRSVQPAIVLGVFSLAFMVAMLVGRLMYFGYPLPNTYYVNVGDERALTALKGATSIARFLIVQPIHVLTLVGILLAGLRWLRHDSKAEDDYKLRESHKLGWFAYLGLAGAATWCVFLWKGVDKHRHEVQAAELGRSLGMDLNQKFSAGPLPTVGVTAAGGLAYAYRGRVVDLLGLNLPRMATPREYGAVPQDTPRFRATCSGRWRQI
jgi:hypothetical protein